MQLGFYVSYDLSFLVNLIGVECSFKYDGSRYETVKFETSMGVYDCPIDYFKSRYKKATEKDILKYLSDELKKYITENEIKKLQEIL